MPAQYEVHGRTQFSYTDVSSALPNLRLNTNVPKPTFIPANHAFVRIRAAALNFRDNMVIAHHPAYPDPHAQDLVPCADGAGEIESVGEGSSWKIGQRLLLSLGDWIDWEYNGDAEFPGFENVKSLGSKDANGTLREYVVVSDELLIAAPGHLSWEELATLPVGAGTAWHALFAGPKSIKPGHTVVAQGTGGVSCFVIQLAAALGATVIATSSSDDKLKVARELGATHTINYRTRPDWAGEVLRLTDGKGADMVVDVAGSSTIEQSIQATKPHGIIPVIGFLSQSKEADLVPSILFGGKTVYGTLLFTRTMIERAVQLMEEKNVRPKVGSVYDWENAPSAFEELGRQSFVGKIVVRVGRRR